MTRLTEVWRAALGGLTVAVRCDAPPGPPGLRALLARWRACPRAARGRAHLTWDLRVRPRRPQLARQGRALLRSRRLEDLLAVLELDAQHQVAVRSPALPLHAAAVALGGRAVVLVGRSGAGKSTLARALVEGGAEYVSEEVTFLGPDAHVTGWPRPIRVDAPGSAPAPESASDLRRPPRPAGAGLRRPRVEVLPDAVRAAPAPVGLVVLLGVPRAVEAAPSAVGPAALAVALLGHLLRPPWPRDLPLAAGLSAALPAVRLAREGPAAAARAVERALAARA